jgi:hypothetical protein
MKRKFKTYVLWIKWGAQGWRPQMEANGITGQGYTESPRVQLKKYLEWAFFDGRDIYSVWTDGVTYMILPKGKKPRGAK